MKQLFSITAMLLLFVMPLMGRNNTYAVVVGISDYKYPKYCPSLHGLTIKSARMAADFFYTHNDCNTFMLLNGNATKDHILRVMKSQYAKADKDDIVMFIFSGHGYPGGLTTYEFNGTMSTAVTYEEIQQIMRGCKASRKIILAEACYSGGIKNNKNGGGTSNKSSNRLYRQPIKSEVLVYTSSRAGEVSYVPGFMEYVVKGLSGYADRNNDHAITARELFNYVNSSVISWTSNKQHPQMWGNFNDNMVLAYC